MTFSYWLPFAFLLKKVFRAALTAAEDTFEGEFQLFDCWGEVLGCIHIERFLFLSYSWTQRTEELLLRELIELI